MKKYTFPELPCHSCPDYQVVGSPCETRYCKGFKRKKPRRFRSSDPKIKAPKWCPKRLTSPVCRIYGFVDAKSEMMAFMLQRDCAKDGLKYSPSPHHYKMRKEVSLGMTAKRFYEETQVDYLKNILPPDADVKSNEVIEIDDGLQPYYFFVDSWDRVTPLPYFKIQENKEGNQK